MKLRPSESPDHHILISIYPSILLYSRNMVQENSKIIKVIHRPGTNVIICYDWYPSVYIPKIWIIWKFIIFHSFAFPVELFENLLFFTHLHSQLILFANMKTRFKHHKTSMCIFNLGNKSSNHWISWEMTPDNWISWKMTPIVKDMLCINTCQHMASFRSHWIPKIEIFGIEIFGKSIIFYLLQNLVIF